MPTWTDDDVFGDRDVHCSRCEPHTNFHYCSTNNHRDGARAWRSS